MNRAVFVLLIILCLFSISSITGLIQVAKAGAAPIHINADGSISPSNAPIHSADNITYTLTGNITTTANIDGIVIERNNSVLNGAGYTVTGPGGWGNGILLPNISNVTVRNVTITNFAVGIKLDTSYNCTFSSNTVTANIYCGIYINSSDDNVLSGNTVTANSNYGGIWLYSASDNNTLSGNNVTANSDYGILLSSSSNNIIYHNNFVNNTNQVYSSNSTNVWDNGSVGNYWSDYLTRYPSAAQVDSSGVWNTSYVIDANNTDHYSLMVPYVAVPEFPSLLILPLFMIATLLAVIIYRKKGVKTSQSWRARLIPP